MDMDDMNVIIIETIKDPDCKEDMEVMDEKESPSPEKREIRTVQVAVGCGVVLSRSQLEALIDDPDEMTNFTFESKKVRPNSSQLWNDFNIITYRGQIQEYVQCRKCKYLVAHKKGTGLAGMLRHRCEAKRRRLTGSVTPKKMRDWPSQPPPKSADSIAESQLEYIVQDLVSPLVMEGPGFKQLVKGILQHGAQYGCHMPTFLSGTDLAARILPNKVYVVRMKIGQLLVENDVAFSFELWETDLGKQCISMDGQCLSEDFRLLSFHLGSRIIPNVELKSVRGGLISILKDYVTSADDLLERSVLVGDEMACAAKAVDDMINANESLESIMKNALNLKLDDNGQIEEISKFFQIFSDCYSSLTSTEKPTVNEVFLWKKKFDQHLREDPDDNPLLAGLKEKAAASFFSFPTHRNHLIGVFLDPRFKSLKFCKQGERAEILEIVKETLGFQVADEPKVTEKSVRNDSYFSEFMDSDDECANQSVVYDDASDGELKKYMNWKSPCTDVLQFWNQNNRFPRLKSLARKVLCIPAATKKNIFSPTVKVFLEKRGTIESENMDNILFLHQNIEKGFIKSIHTL